MMEPARRVPDAAWFIWEMAEPWPEPAARLHAAFVHSARHGRRGRFEQFLARRAGSAAYSRRRSMKCPVRAITACRGAGARPSPRRPLAQSASRACRRRRPRRRRSRPPAQPNDPFGDEVTLTAKTIIFIKGNSTWDKALETLVDAFKSVYALLDKQGIKPKAGPAMTIYTQADDTGFQFQAAVPIAEAPKDPPQGRHRGRQVARRQGAEVHPSRLVRRDGQHLRGDHQLSRREAARSRGHLHRGIRRPIRSTTPEDKLVVTVYVPLEVIGSPTRHGTRAGSRSRRRPRRRA